ncbi:pentatricopeptide (PPR) repeat-containing protein-like [Oryza sativa Japonica Group]|uniref:Pentatricopeptide (PPR) repeat-containing protein-like n=1 Tax=Oryza sativa subsp. japonica TaxID=39947 RepID=Q5VN96_ORYSJ|nr:pentatricopeptide (PPR) repeat-containing protein-like [Oryza sativa Japonica Group]
MPLPSLTVNESSQPPPLVVSHRLPSFSPPPLPPVSGTALCRHHRPSATALPGYMGIEIQLMGGRGDRGDHRDHGASTRSSTVSRSPPTLRSSLEERSTSSRRCSGTTSLCPTHTPCIASLARAPVLALSATAFLLALPEGRQLHALATKLGLVPSHTIIAKSLLHLYSSGGLSGVALDLFRCIPDRLLVSWNTAVDALG